MLRCVSAALLLASLAPAARASVIPATYAELRAKAEGVVVGRVVGIEPRAGRGGAVRVEYRVLVAATEKGPARPGEVVAVEAWFSANQPPRFSCAPEGTMALPGVGETTRAFYDAGNKVYANGFWPPQPPARDGELFPPDPAVGIDRAEMIRRAHPLGLPIDLRNWHWWALALIALFAAVSAGRPGGRRRASKAVAALALLVAAAPAATATPPGTRMPYRELQAKSGGIVVGRVLAIDAREDRNDDGPVVRVEYRLLVGTVERGLAVPGDELRLSAWFAKDRPFSFGCSAPVGVSTLPGVGEATRVFYGGSRAGGEVNDNGFWPPTPPAREDAWYPTSPMAEADRWELERRTHPYGLPIDIRNWYWWALSAALLLAAVAVVGRRRARRAAASRPSPRA